VGGATVEELDHSIEMAKVKSAQILADVQAAQNAQRRQIPLPTTSGPPVDMLGGQENERSLSAEDIRNMSMDEYRQYRNQLKDAASERVRTQGLYQP